MSVNIIQNQSKLESLEFRWNERWRRRQKQKKKIIIKYTMQMVFGGSTTVSSVVSHNFCILFIRKLKVPKKKKKKRKRPNRLNWIKINIMFNAQTTWPMHNFHCIHWMCIDTFVSFIYCIRKKIKSNKIRCFDTVAETSIVLCLVITLTWF